MDLICCRNVLIYFDTELQEKLIPILHYGLKPSGFLVLGESESIGKFTDLFTPLEKRGSIFIKKKTLSKANYGFNASQVIARVPAVKDIKKDLMNALKEDVDRIIMSKYVPAMMLVNSKLDILIFRGYLAPFVLPEAGVASLSVNRMVREELKLEIETAIYRVKKENKQVTVEGVEVKIEGETKRVTIEVLPLKNKDFDQQFYLVLLRESAPRIAPLEDGECLSETERAGKDLRLRELRDELESSKQSLQTVIEEQEGTNEELRAAMEEVQSSNEELQSTNEELETAKEELQSTNEELKTLNEELKTRNDELTRSNDDLSNVIRNMDLAMVIVDGNLRIRWFTPYAEQILELYPNDVDRPIENIRFSHTHQGSRKTNLRSHHPIKCRQN
jgi:two-component system, chemotaxis family, CheB/CheR fusion protein